MGKILEERWFSKKSQVPYSVGYASEKFSSDMGKHENQLGWTKLVTNISYETLLMWSSTMSLIVPHSPFFYWSFQLNNSLDNRCPANNTWCLPRVCLDLSHRLKGRIEITLFMLRINCLWNIIDVKFHHVMVHTVLSPLRFDLNVSHIFRVCCFSLLDLTLCLPLWALQHTP